MTKIPKLKLLAASIVSIVLISYAWYWGTREEQELPDPPYIAEQNKRAAAHAEAIKAYNIQQARTTPTPISVSGVRLTPTLHPLTGPEVEAMGAYMNPGSFLSNWQKQQLADAERVKASYAHLKKATAYYDVVRERYETGGRLREILTIERKLHIWHGSKSKDERTRNLYRQKIAAKDREIAAVTEQQIRDQEVLVRINSQ